MAKTGYEDYEDDATSGTCRRCGELMKRGTEKTEHKGCPNK